MSKISLTSQIQEVASELNKRRSVYPRMIAARRIKQDLADYQMKRLDAVLATLQWLKENEAAIRRKVDVMTTLTAAAHALRSYEHGNASPELAREIAEKCEALIGKDAA
ncbi:hypothetical protein [Rhodopseudomonas sp. BR0G17]|uniref:hypothetical protein n=1 Tax=Rhodopseudomonas sp. BR0G17 TaxID=2269368 RepID=UPI0013DF9948|nr:hypothetical protein [Rhodopseudomonas sp. BR0G17]NEW95482.1 hypothetical protein [Rhodopseudomonas sp. BR0G17]